MIGISNDFKSITLNNNISLVFGIGILFNWLW